MCVTAFISILLLVPISELILWLTLPNAGQGYCCLIVCVSGNIRTQSWCNEPTFHCYCGFMPRGRKGVGEGVMEERIWIRYTI